MAYPKQPSESDLFFQSNFASRYARDSLPRFSMPENSMPKEVAYQNIHDELQLDGNPKLNLASFVTTAMEEECNKLIMESINQNYVNMDEYPITTELHEEKLVPSVPIDPQIAQALIFSSVLVSALNKNSFMVDRCATYLGRESLA